MSNLQRRLTKDLAEAQRLAENSDNILFPEYWDSAKDSEKFEKAASGDSSTERPPIAQDPKEKNSKVKASPTKPSPDTTADTSKDKLARAFAGSYPGVKERAEIANEKGQLTHAEVQHRFTTPQQKH